MAVAYVQSNHTRAFGGGPDAVTLNGVTAGNLLIVAVGWLNYGQTISSVAGNGNTYTPIDAYAASTDGGGALSTFYVKNAASGNTTVTVTWSGEPGFHDIYIYEVSGCDTTAPLDVHATNYQHNVGSGADAITTGAVTTTAGGEFIFGVAFDQAGNSNTWAAGTNFTAKENSFGVTEYLTQTTAGSIAATFTYAQTFCGVVSAIATFKAAGGAATSILRQMLAHHGA